MRIFKNFGDAHSELIRDVASNGLQVFPQSMQDKEIAGDPQYGTREIQNYSYCVTGPKLEDLNPDQPWADDEFKERISKEHINPGEAWKHRPEVWTEFLHPGDDSKYKFAYSYNERLNYGRNLERIIERIKVDTDSRQLYLPVFFPDDLLNMGGISRVPCSLGYLFQVRNDRVNMTYYMRSCDVFTHFHNDVYLAFRLQQHVAIRTGHQTGTFTHDIASLHIYNKDIVGIF
jgi:thymidylate synthase